MKRIDAEIAAVEQRIAAHKVGIAYNASAAKQRAARKLKSPAMLAVGAAVAGLVVVAMVRRRKPTDVPQRRSIDREQGKGLALGTLAMTGVTWFIRSQFGGPVGLAQFLLSKVRERRVPATAVPAEFRHTVPR